MSAITIFLGRLLGLYLVAISGGMLANRRRTLATLDEMARSGPWMLFSGMVATAGGLAVVLGHQVWSGGALPVLRHARRLGGAPEGSDVVAGSFGADCRGLQGHRFRTFLPRLDGRRAGSRALGDGDGVRRLITRPKRSSGSARHAIVLLGPLGHRQSGYGDHLITAVAPSVGATLSPS